MGNRTLPVCVASVCCSITQPCLFFFFFLTWYLGQMRLTYTLSVQHMVDSTNVQWTLQSKFQASQCPKRYLGSTLHELSIQVLLKSHFVIKVLTFRCTFICKKWHCEDTIGSACLSNIGVFYWLCMLINKHVNWHIIAFGWWKIMDAMGI